MLKTVSTNPNGYITQQKYKVWTSETLQEDLLPQWSPLFSVQFPTPTTAPIDGSVAPLFVDERSLFEPSVSASMQEKLRLLGSFRWIHESPWCSDSDSDHKCGWLVWSHAAERPTCWCVWSMWLWCCFRLTAFFFNHQCVYSVFLSVAVGEVAVVSMQTSFAREGGTRLKLKISDTEKKKEIIFNVCVLFVFVIRHLF